MLTVDGTSIQDWKASGAFSSFGSIGLLATRTGAPASDPAALRTSAYASLGAGTPVAVGPDERPAGRRGDALPGLLGEALARRRMFATAIGESGVGLGDAPAGLAVMRLDGTAASRPSTYPSDAAFASADVSRIDPDAPGGRRTDPVALQAALKRTLEWATLIVVDLADAERADRAFTSDAAARAMWVGRALADADRVAASLLGVLSPSDTLVVASLVPPLERERAGVHLGAVAFAGRRGAPTSGTTRQEGVIALSDLAPTILRRAGVEPPAEMQGRAVRFVSGKTSMASIASLDSDLARALRSRRPLTRTWLIAAAVLSVAAFATILAGRGRAPGRSRLPRTRRDLLGIGLIATAAAPAAFLIAPALARSGSVAGVGWWVLGLSLASAVAARAAFGHAGGLAAIALIDALLYAADLAAGSPLAARSAIGFQIAGGGRFYGVDEGMLGVLLAAPLVAAGVCFERVRNKRGILIVSAVGLALIAFLASAPAFGSKFGAPFTLVPAFGVFLVLASGRRLAKTSAIGIAIATIFLSASLAAADALSAPESSSHIGREIAGKTAVGALVTRKLTSLVKITVTTVWLPATILIAGSAFLLLARRRDLVARAMWGRPATRAALTAAVVGSTFAMISNDTGIITVAAAAPIAAACFYGALLTPEQGEP